MTARPRPIVPSPFPRRLHPNAPVRHRRAATALVAAVVLAGIATAGRAEEGSPEPPADRRNVSGATSDLLIVLDVDGHPHVYQHTLSSDGALVRMALPENLASGQVSFAGRGRAALAAAHRRSPGRIALRSGSAIVRRRDPHAAGTSGTDPAGEVVLRAPSVPDGLVVEDGTLAVSRTTWAFPEALELVSFTSVADGHGRWHASDSLLSFEQSGDEPTTLRVRWRRRPPVPAVMDADADADVDKNADAGADPDPGPDADVDVDVDVDLNVDVDADGVPDHRDICLGADRGSAPRPDSETGVADRAGVDALGCTVPTYDSRPVRVLEGIAFPAGQSYLDLAARELLDRLSRALEHAPESTWEIAAHTDGAGSRARNLRLSETRAKAVRHYLMLRGIAPNRLRTQGHGEARPIGDDRTVDGRRANRRIEIVRID